MITGKPYFFSAGADLDEFSLGAAADLAREGSKKGHELFGRIRALPYPTVAAINGACLGGGVELALHCDARTISTAVRHFACPECLLGIVPGWGGTQLVPRLVGAETAIEFVVESPLRQNRMLDGRRARELGCADRLLEPAEFVDESIAYAVGLAKRPPETRPGARPGDMPLADVLGRARARLDDAVHGAAPAPYRALELIQGRAGVPQADQVGPRHEQHLLRTGQRGAVCGGRGLDAEQLRADVDYDPAIPPRQLGDQPLDEGGRETGAHFPLGRATQHHA